MRPDIEHLFWYLTVGFEAVLFLRLLGLRIARKYRWFIFYVSALLLQDILLLLVSRSGPAFATNAYWRTWSITESVMLSLQIAFTLEAYRLVRDFYPGISAAGTRVIQRVVIFAALACIASLIPDLNTVHWQPTLSLLFVLKRSVATIAAVMLGLVVSIMAYMPVLMARNIKVHVRLALAYLASNALGYFGVNVLWGSIQIWSALMMAASVVCFALWIVLMTRAGEITPAPDTSKFDPYLEREWAEMKAVARTAPKIFQFRWRG